MISADRAEDLADNIDKELRERLPMVPHVFIDPTQLQASAIWTDPDAPQLSTDKV